MLTVFALLSFTLYNFTLGVLSSKLLPHTGLEWSSLLYSHTQQYLRQKFQVVWAETWKNSGYYKNYRS